MKKQIATAVFAAVLMGTLLLSAACTGKKELPKSAPEAVREVTLVTVQRRQMPSYYEAIGTVRPIQSAQIAAQLMGNIIAMNVREGDRVRRGQVLAVIDDSQTRAALDRALAGQRASAQELVAANSDFALAESTLKRYQVLQDKKSVSPHEFEEVSARCEAAKARREMAQANIAGAEAAVAQARTAQGYSFVRAPFPGVITAKLAETGNLASPGVPIYTLEDSTAFRLEVTVDERNMAAVRLGATVPVSLDAVGNETFEGRIVQMLPSADASSRTFLVKVEVPKNPSIHAGLFGRARFSTGSREGYSLPKSAIVNRGSLQAVYAIGSDQVASLRYVTLGQSSGDQLEVLSGLENGDRIVAAPGDRELNGKKIEVR